MWVQKNRLVALLLCWVHERIAVVVLWRRLSIAHHVLAVAVISRDWNILVALHVWSLCCVVLLRGVWIGGTGVIHI